jgi:hypothetical protein
VEVEEGAGVGGSGDEGMSGCEHDPEAKNPCKDVWMLPQQADPKL